MSEKKRDLFTEIYGSYYPLVFSAVYTRVDDADDARDICQEVFIKLYEKLDEVQNTRKWLYGALRLSVFEFYRKRGRGVNIDEVDDVALTFVNGMRDTRIMLSEAFENSANFEKEGDRALFDLVAFYNFSYSQAAQHLGLTKRQVEYKYRRIVDRITGYLKQKGVNSIEDLL